MTAQTIVYHNGTLNGATAGTTVNIPSDGTSFAVTVVRANDQCWSLGIQSNSGHSVSIINGTFTSNVGTFTITANGSGFNYSGGFACSSGDTFTMYFRWNSTTSQIEVSSQPISGGGTCTNAPALNRTGGTASQTVCEGSAISNITYTRANATGIRIRFDSDSWQTTTQTKNGLTITLSGTTAVVSGTPTATTSYTIETTGKTDANCSTEAQATGTITRNAAATLARTGGAASQSVTSGTAISGITYTRANATGIRIRFDSDSWQTTTQTKNGLTITLTGTTAVVSGTPTATTSYTIETTGNNAGCSNVATGSGTITVTATCQNAPALARTGGAASQAVCGTAISSITYTRSNATGIRYRFDSDGWQTGTSTKNNVTITISGTTAVVSGTPDATTSYTIETTGKTDANCPTEAQATGTITRNTTTLTSANRGGSNNICVGSTGTATTSPAGLTGTWESSDMALATITNAGVVTALAPVTSADNLRFTFTETSSGCSAQTGTIDNFYALPTLPRTGGEASQSVTSGTAISSITYTRNAATGIRIRFDSDSWQTTTQTKNGLTITLSGTTAVVSGTPTATTSYTIETTGNACSTASAATGSGTITVTTGGGSNGCITNWNLPSQTGICKTPTAGTFNALSVTAGAGTTYQWYRNTSNSNTGGTSISGATSATYTPLVSDLNIGTNYYYYCVASSTSTTGSNLVQNGTFTSTSNWTFQANSGGGGRAMSGNVMTITISSTQAGTYQPQVVQTGINLTQNTRYRVTYTASAAQPRTIEVNVGQSSGSYNVHQAQVPNLTTTNQTFSFDFTMPDATGSSNQLAFNVGGNGTNSTSSVYISNVSIHALTSSVCGTTDPSGVHTVVDCGGTPACTAPSFGSLSRCVNEEIALTPDGGTWSVKSGSATISSNTLTIGSTAGTVVLTYAKSGCTSVDVSVSVSNTGVCDPNQSGQSCTTVTLLNAACSQGSGNLYSFTTDGFTITNGGLHDGNLWCRNTHTDIGQASSNYYRAKSVTLNPGVHTFVLTTNSTKSSNNTNNAKFFISSTSPSGANRGTLVRDVFVTGLTTSFSVTITGSPVTYYVGIYLPQNGDNMQLKTITHEACVITCSAPTGLSQPSAASVSGCEGSILPPLLASAIGTDVTYQWFRTTANTATGGSSVANTASYTPAAGDYRYYYIATENCTNGSKASATSSVSGLYNVYGTDVSIACVVPETIESGSRIAVPVTITGTNLKPGDTFTFALTGDDAEDFALRGNSAGTTPPTLTVPAQGGTSFTGNLYLEFLESGVSGEKEFTIEVSSLGAGSCVQLPLISCPVTIDAEKLLQVVLTATPAAGPATTHAAPGEEVRLDASIPDGDLYTWYRVIGGVPTQIGQTTQAYFDGAHFIAGHPTQQFYVVVEKAGYKPATSNTITLNLRTVSITGSLVACGAGEVTLTATLTPSITPNTARIINWWQGAIGNGDPIKSASGTGSNTVSVPAGTYIAEVLIAGGGAFHSAPVTVTAAPAFGTTAAVTLEVDGGNATPCTGSNVGFTAKVNIENAGEYTWRWVVNGVQQTPQTITLGTGTNISLGTRTINGISSAQEVAVQITDCSGATKTATVAVTPQTCAHGIYVRNSNGGSDSNTGENWGSAYATLQKALGDGVTNAPAGMPVVIYMAAGTYSPATSSYTIPTGREITIKGGYPNNLTGKDLTGYSPHFPTCNTGNQTTIRPNTGNQNRIMNISSGTVNVTFEGITFTQGENGDTNGRLLNTSGTVNGNITFKSCYIHSFNGGSQAYGTINLTNASSSGNNFTLTMDGCHVENNVSVKTGVFAITAGTPRIRIVNSYFTNNRASDTNNDAAPIMHISGGTPDVRIYNTTLYKNPNVTTGQASRLFFSNQSAATVYFYNSTLFGNYMSTTSFTPTWRFENCIVEALSLVSITDGRVINSYVGQVNTIVPNGSGANPSANFIGLFKTSDCCGNIPKFDPKEDANTIAAFQTTVGNRPNPLIIDNAAAEFVSQTRTDICGTPRGSVSTLGAVEVSTVKTPLVYFNPAEPNMTIFEACPPKVDDRSYDIIGRNLENNIVVSVPSGFQLSLTGTSGWSNTVTVTPVAGSVNQKIHVRMNTTTPPAAGLFITHASNDLSIPSIPLFGTLKGVPPAAVLELSANHICDTDNSTELELTATLRGAYIGTYTVTWNINGTTHTTPPITVTTNGAPSSSQRTVSNATVRGWSAAATATVTVTDACSEVTKTATLNNLKDNFLRDCNLPPLFEFNDQIIVYTSPGEGTRLTLPGSIIADLVDATYAWDRGGTIILGADRNRHQLPATDQSPYGIYTLTVTPREDLLDDFSAGTVIFDVRERKANFASGLSAVCGVSGIYNQVVQVTTPLNNGETYSYELVRGTTGTNVTNWAVVPNSVNIFATTVGYSFDSGTNHPFNVAGESYAVKVSVVGTGGAFYTNAVHIAPKPKVITLSQPTVTGLYRKTGCGTNAEISDYVTITGSCAAAGEKINVTVPANFKVVGITGATGQIDYDENGVIIEIQLAAGIPAGEYAGYIELVSSVAPSVTQRIFVRGAVVNSTSDRFRRKSGEVTISNICALDACQTIFEFTVDNDGSSPWGFTLEENKNKTGNADWQEFAMRMEENVPLVYNNPPNRNIRLEWRARSVSAPNPKTFYINTNTNPYTLSLTKPTNTVVRIGHDTKPVLSGPLTSAWGCGEPDVEVATKLICAGGTSVLKASVRDLVRPEYAWYYRTATGVYGDEPIPGVYGDECPVSEPGFYKLVITDNARTYTSNEAELIVKRTISNSDVTTVATTVEACGNSIVLTATLTAANGSLLQPGKYEVQWSVNGTSLGAKDTISLYEASNRLTALKGYSSALTALDNVSATFTGFGDCGTAGISTGTAGVVAVVPSTDCFNFYVKKPVNGGSDAPTRGRSWDQALATVEYALGLVQTYYTQGGSMAVIHVAAGDYTPATQAAGSCTGLYSSGTGATRVQAGYPLQSNVTIIGGYPAKAKLGDVSNPVSPANVSGNATVFSPQSQYGRILELPRRNGTNVVKNNVTIKGIKFDGKNDGRNCVGGTAVFMESGSLTLDSCWFTNFTCEDYQRDRADNRLGAYPVIHVFRGDSVTLNVNHTTFSNNYGWRTGGIGIGGIYETTDGTWTSSTTVRPNDTNTAGNSTGIADDQTTLPRGRDINVNIRNSTFTDLCGNYGGAGLIVRASVANVNVYNSTFYNNSALRMRPITGGNNHEDRIAFRVEHGCDITTAKLYFYNATIANTNRDRENWFGSNAEGGDIRFYNSVVEELTNPRSLTIGNAGNNYIHDITVRQINSNNNEGTGDVIPAQSSVSKSYSFGSLFQGNGGVPALQSAGGFTQLLIPDKTDRMAKDSIIERCAPLAVDQNGIEVNTDQWHQKRTAYATWFGTYEEPRSSSKMISEDICYGEILGLESPVQLNDTIKGVRYLVFEQGKPVPNGNVPMLYVTSPGIYHGHLYIKGCATPYYTDLVTINYRNSGALKVDSLVSANPLVTKPFNPQEVKFCFKRPTLSLVIADGRCTEWYHNDVPTLSPSALKAIHDEDLMGNNMATFTENIIWSNPMDKISVASIGCDGIQHTEEFEFTPDCDEPILQLVTIPVCDVQKQGTSGLGEDDWIRQISIEGALIWNSEIADDVNAAMNVSYEWYDSEKGSWVKGEDFPISKDGDYRIRIIAGGLGEYEYEDNIRLLLENEYLLKVRCNLLWLGKSPYWRDAANWAYCNEKGTEDVNTPITNTNFYAHECHNVYLRDNVDYYPDLVTKDACRDIFFGVHTAIAKPHNLSYRRAHVDMTIPVFRPFTDPNTHNWHMVSAPLKGMLSGDYTYNSTSTGSDSYNDENAESYRITSYIRYFSASKTGDDYVGKWTLSVTSTQQILKEGMGYALRYATSDPNLTNVHTFRFPKPGTESGKENPYRFVAETSSVGEGKYEISPSHTVEIDLRDRFSAAEADELDKMSWAEIEANHSMRQSGSYLIVGNPFMSHLDLHEFYRLNKKWITPDVKRFVGETSVLGTHAMHIVPGTASDSHKWSTGTNNDHPVENETGSGHWMENDVFDGTNVVTTYSDESMRYVPPMQSFFVRLTPLALHEINNGTETAPKGKIRLNFPPEKVTVAKKGHILKSLSNNGENKLNLQVEQGTRTTLPAIVAARSGASNGYYAMEDAQKLFTDEALLQLYTLAGTLACDVNVLNADNLSDVVVPIGIRVKAAGKTTLSISGATGFSAADNIWLVDSKEGTRISLLERETFEFDLAAGTTEDRFYLYFEQTPKEQGGTTGTPDIDALTDAIYVSSTGNMLNVLSKVEPLAEVTVYDIMGRIVYEAAGLSSNYFSYRLPNAPEVYLVKAVTAKQTVTKKVIVK